MENQGQDSAQTTKRTPQDEGASVTFHADAFPVVPMFPVDNGGRYAEQEGADGYVGHNYVVVH